MQSLILESEKYSDSSVTVPIRFSIIHVMNIKNKKQKNIWNEYDNSKGHSLNRINCK